MSIYFVKIKITKDGMSESRTTFIDLDTTGFEDSGDFERAVYSEIGTFGYGSYTQIEITDISLMKQTKEKE